MTISPGDPRWQNFLSVARAYISLIETADKDEPVALCTKLHRALLDLQIAALDLPELKIDNNDPVMVTDAKTADPAPLKEALDFRYLMQSQVLQIATSPLAEGPEVREVASDLADLYNELQDVLALNEERYIDDAAGQARTGYIEDWGYLVVSLQAALWKYIAEAAIDAQERASPSP